MSVTVYSTQTCPYCVMVKNYLREKNIAYTDWDVGRDELHAREMVQKSGQMGVPVVDINGKVIIGFDRPAIERALGV